MADQSKTAPCAYQFDDVLIDCTELRVHKGEQPIKITPRAFAVLVYLVEHRGRMIERQELFEQVWKERFVTDNALAKIIKEIRRVIGDEADAPRYIETVPRHGYRFIAEAQTKQDKNGLPEDPVSFSSPDALAPPEGRQGDATRQESLPATATEDARASLRLGQTLLEFDEPPAAPTFYVPAPQPPSTVTYLRARFREQKAIAGLAVESIATVTYLRARMKQHKVRAGMAVAALALAVAAIIHFSKSEKAIHSLVVLPLENAAADASTEYMSDGITESLINSLSQLSELKVIASTTAFRYKGQAVDPQKVGRDLHVDAVLTGKVIQQGDNLIIQADLANAVDGTQLWGRRYTRKMGDILSLQEEIAKEISEKLRLKLTGEEEKRVTRRYTDNTEAYQLYLLGRYFWNKRTADGLKKSIDYFQQAIAKDPNYALAYVGLADSYSVLAVNTDVPPRETFPKAKAAALKALELDDTLVEAHATMLYPTDAFDWDWPGVEKEYQRALELNPQYPLTHHHYGLYLMERGRFNEAIAEIKRAQELDPLSLITNTMVGRVYLYARRYDDAIAACQKTLEIDPNFFVAHLFLGKAYKEKGRYEEAIRELSRARELSGGLSEARALLGCAYAAAGKRGEAEKVLKEMQEAAKQRYVPPYDLALLYAGLGEKDEAFELLEKAYKDRNELLALLNVEPEFDSLHTDPRFADLLRRIG